MVLNLDRRTLVVKSNSYFLDTFFLPISGRLCYCEPKERPISSANVCNRPWCPFRRFSIINDVVKMADDIEHAFLAVWWAGLWLKDKALSQNTLDDIRFYKPSRGKYSPIFTSPSANNCFSTITEVNIREKRYNCFRIYWLRVRKSNENYFHWSYLHRTGWISKINEFLNQSARGKLYIRLCNYIPIVIIKKYIEIVFRFRNKNLLKKEIM
jgi:hypothetical protein